MAPRDPSEMVTLKIPQQAYDAVNRAESLTVRVVEK